jgi:hypothetical protein
MIERHIHSLCIEDPGTEEPAATRERLGAGLPRGAARRMTQLGLLLGSAFEKVRPGPEDTIVYASTYAESRALEDYLASFPTPSPTLFQSSIHPSAVQQALIVRNQPVSQLFPLTGRGQLVAHAVQAALLSGSACVILCGGEERGTWTREHGMASSESFAFALALTRDNVDSLGTLALEPGADPDGDFTLPQFFAALRSGSPLRQQAAPGLTLTLTWH